MGKEPIQVWPSWGNDKWSDPDAGSGRIAPGPSDATTCSRVWDYFAAHYRREYGREPDPDNKQTVLMCAWYVTGASDLAARRKFFPENA